MTGMLGSFWGLMKRDEHCMIGRVLESITYVHLCMKGFHAVVTDLLG